MMIYVNLLCLFAFCLTANATCIPGEDGKFTGIKLGGPSNISAPLGTDVHFICCGGYKWTYETDSEYAGREIGPHPEAAGSPNSRTNVEKGLMTPFSVTESQKERSATPTTVYTMHDDKGRLLLIINNVDTRDMGHYRCHALDGTAVDAFLVVTAQKYSDDESNPTVIATGSVIQRYMMFPSDKLSKVILPCPVTGSQIIHSWLWHKPILPISEEFAKIQPDKPSRLLVTARTEGNHGLVEIGPKLAWARIVDPLSPEAPTKLWCQFEVPSEWENKDPVVAYFTINWELYEPISPKVYLLNSNSGNRINDGKSEVVFTESLSFHGSQEKQSSKEVPQTYTRVYDPAVLMLQFQEAQRNENNQVSLAVLEHKPARFGCQFRVVDKNGPAQTDGQKWPMQQVFWYRDNLPVHVPPFQVYNELVASHGIALLEIRAYPVSFQQNSPKGEYSTNNSPVERITCVVTSQVKDKPVYKVTTNASLDVEVILIPRIINKTLLFAERNVDDAVKLTCVTIANGPPEMIFEFSSTSRSSQGLPAYTIPEWTAIQPRYGLNLRRIQPDNSDPTLHKLILDNSDLRRTDHGLYRCTVTNKAGRAQAVGQILVRSQPEMELIPAESTYFVSHKPWIASCLVTGYPLAWETKPTRKKRSVEFEEEDDHNHSTESTEDLAIPSETPPATNSSVQLKLFTMNGQPMNRVTINLINYEANKFFGINATYEVHMNQRLGKEALVRCEYTHTDKRVVYRESMLREATKPPSPNITVLCAGPRAVVFGVTNPLVHKDSLPTERIVTQKVIFGPAKTFHNSASMDSLLVYLDSDGQPSASPANRSDETLPHATVTSSNRKATTPHTAIIPVKGLQADTEYVFEWSSGNEFGLSVMVQFTLWTTPLETSPAVKNVVFLKPTANFLRFSTFLADPCPYGGGVRAELSDLLVRYRPAKSNGSAETLIGQGEWSEMQVCRNLLDADKSESQNNGQADDDEEQEGIQWAGDKPIPCEVSMPDAEADYEVQIATRNRFGKSDWFTAIYRPALAVHSAALCYPPCESICKQWTVFNLVICVFLILLIY